MIKITLGERHNQDYMRTFWFNQYSSYFYGFNESSFSYKYLDEFVIVFIVDTLIYSDNEEQDKKHLRLAPGVLIKDKFYATFTKYDFWIKELLFIGQII